MSICEARLTTTVLMSDSQESDKRGDALECKPDNYSSGTSQEPEQKDYHDSTFNRHKTLISNYVNRIVSDYPTPTERYYDIRFVSSKDQQNFFGTVGDQCIMFHSNKLCLVALAPTHPVIAEDKTIVRIEFRFEGHVKIDRLASVASGKRKRGSQKLRRSSPICALLCSDETKYVVIPCIGSRLVEINESIMTNPALVKTHPLSQGYIAIIEASDWKHLDETKTKFPKLDEGPELAGRELQSSRKEPQECA